MKKLIKNIKLIQKRIDNNLPEILEDVSDLRGIVCISETKQVLGYRGKYVDYYLAMSVLGELMKKGQIKVELTTDVIDVRIDYLYRLLNRE